MDIHNKHQFYLLLAIVIVVPSLHLCQIIKLLISNQKEIDIVMKAHLFPLGLLSCS